MKGGADGMLEELDNIEVCDEGILGLRGNSRVVSLNIESYEEWTATGAELVASL